MRTYTVILIRTERIAIDVRDAKDGEHAARKAKQIVRDDRYSGHDITKTTVRLEHVL